MRPAAARAIIRDSEPIEILTIPKAEHERACAMEEDLADLQAGLAVQAKIDAGVEELVPGNIAGRLIDGEPPVRVWREHRGLSQSALARASGVHRVQVADIEAERKTGSIHTLRKLADALGVTVDDLVSA